MNEKCNLCGSKEFELIKSELRDSNQHLKVFRCIACEHIQILPRPTKEDDLEFYDRNLQDKNREKDIDFQKLRINSLFDTERHVRLIRKISADLNCRVLDIGSGYGFFVNELSNHGYKNVIGIEISEERRHIALEHGTVPIMDIDVDMPGKDIGRFDIVTLFHVLEHMADPIIFLRNLKKLLNPGGVFVCEVPNVQEMLLDNCEAYNAFYWIRAHLNYFSKRTFVRCLEQAGFCKMDIIFEQRYGLINLCNWLENGKPQMKRPVFEICSDYAPVEEFYREHLKKHGKTDAMIALARA